MRILLLAASALIGLNTAIPLFAQTHEGDSLVLVAVYNATDGVNWTKQENWLSGPVHTWQGVNVGNGRVTEINFNLAGLNGNVPDDIFSLDSLKSFSIRESNAVFHCDSRMEQWTALHTISVSGANMTGEINVFCSMPALTSISLWQMHLGGRIPECLTSLDLTRLNLSNASLDSATLPSFLGEIPTLENISLEGNQFYGTIPPTYCNSHLRFLTLSGNNLSGTVPDCINPEDNLVQLFLDNNHLEGTLPDGVFGSKVSILDISNNEFIGDPSDWPLLNAAIRVEIDHNRFSGTFDGGIMNSSNFRVLRINNNELTDIVNFDTFDLLNTLVVSDNRFDFDDLQVLVPGSSGFQYSPQAELGMPRIIDLDTAETVVLAMSAGGVGTKYQWLKDGEVIAGATSSELTISDAGVGDVGVYSCEATNDSFPLLTLRLAPVTLQQGVSSTNNMYDGTYVLLGNPVTEHIVLTPTTSQDLSGAAELILWDMHGHKVLSRKYRPGHFGDLRIEDLDLTGGIYLLSLTTSKGIGTWRVVVH